MDNDVARFLHNYCRRRWRRCWRHRRCRRLINSRRRLLEIVFGRIRLRRRLRLCHVDVLGHFRIISAFRIFGRIGSRSDGRFGNGVRGRRGGRGRDGALGPSGESVKGDPIGEKLAIWIREKTAQSLFQFRRPTVQRTEKHAAEGEVGGVRVGEEIEDDGASSR